MTTFAQAVETTPASSTTANGMLTLDDSGNALVTLFFAIASSRGKDLTQQFERAIQADPSIALRILFWARDIRGGAGERDTFRKLFAYFGRRYQHVAKRLFPLVHEYGRWDDLLIFDDPFLRDAALDVIVSALKQNDGLCGKWMPRKGPIANSIRRKLSMTPKAYRQLLVGLTKVVETQMCARTWDQINYDHVPSVAAARYQKAFTKHDALRYDEYKKGLVSGVNKINANAVYPYDVVKSVKHGDEEVALAQWEALPNYLGDNKIIPMVDTSGSMENKIGGSKSLTCMDISVSLGLYIADKQTGAFKDLFLTFNHNSRLELLRGNFLSKLSQLRRADWGRNTNLVSAYDEILRVAKSNSVPAEEMPKYLLILSDMEFDVATRSYDGTSIRAQDMAADKYHMAGYELPKIVYWNLNARQGNVPVKFNEQGTALISGFSPAIMKSVLAANQFTPIGIMLETINTARYNAVAECIDNISGIDNIESIDTYKMFQLL